MPRTKGKPATSATPSKVAEAKVKKSRTAKTIFMDETRKKHKGSESEKELKAKWAKLWKELSKAEKTKYTMLAKCEKEASGGAKKEKKVKKDPNMPKRPPSAFQVYQKEQLALLKSENEKASFLEMNKAISAKWKELETADKDAYKQRSEEAKKEYKEELEKYEASLKGTEE